MGFPLLPPKFSLEREVSVVGLLGRFIKSFGRDVRRFKGRFSMLDKRAFEGKRGAKILRNLLFCRIDWITKKQVESEKKIKKQQHFCRLFKREMLKEHKNIC